MTFLPIVDRELRIRARWRSTYILRTMTGAAAVVFAVLMTLLSGMGAAAAIGKEMFFILGWMAFLFCVVEGFRNTADCISEEKRESTLGLLFLTDLKGYDVVLGKLVATSLSSFYALVAMVPALAFPVMLGGVTGGEFWRLVLALMTTLLFCLCCGIFVSSVSRHERRAWTGTVLIVLFFLAVLPGMSRGLHAPMIAIASPWMAFNGAFEAHYLRSPSAYWNSIWISNLLAWLWLALASYLLPKVWQETGERAVVRVAPRENPKQARWKRNQLLATNPVLWLTSRSEHQRGWLWALVIVVITGSFGLWLWGKGKGATGWTVFGCALALHFVLATWVAAEAAASFADARRSGAIELLLSTPLTVREILQGQHLALRHLFAGPVILLIVFEVLVVCGQVYWMAVTNVSSFERVMLVLVVAFSLVWFVADLFAVSRVGMWFGLTSQKPTQAMVKTVLFVLVLPMACLLCTAVAPGLMIAKAVMFFTWAQTRLQNEFRLAASQRFDGRRSDWVVKRPAHELRMPGLHDENYSLMR